MRFAITVTRLTYGTQQASSTFQSTQAPTAEDHELSSVLFYRERVYNANQLASSASDGFDLMRSQQQLDMQRGVAPNICVAAALHHGVVDETETGRLEPASSNLQTRFTLSGFGVLAEASLTCDRAVQS